MEKKKFNTTKDGFNRAQRDYIAEKMVDAFNSSREFKRFGSYLQAVGIEAINFSFKAAPFDYYVESEKLSDDITVERFIFTYEYKIPGTSHTLKIEKKLTKADVLGRL